MWHWAGSCWWDTLPGPWKQENVLEQLLCVTAVTLLFNCRQEHGRDSAAQSCQCCREPHLPLLEKETLTSTKGTLNQAVIQDSAFTPQCSAVGLFQMWWVINGKLQSSWTPSPCKLPAAQEVTVGLGAWKWWLFCLLMAWFIGLKLSWYFRTLLDILCWRKGFLGNPKYFAVLNLHCLSVIRSHLRHLW